MKFRILAESTGITPPVPDDILDGLRTPTAAEYDTMEATWNLKLRHIEKPEHFLRDKSESFKNCLGRIDALIAELEADHG